MKFILLIFLFPVCLYGQVFNFKNFSINNGLSQSQITAIDHDSYGNVWLATYGGGVNQFDGHRFKTFGITQGLPHNQVNDICVDSRNQVWCAMQSGGVAMILENKVYVYRFEGDELDPVNSIAIWRDGVIAGTSNGRVVMITDSGKVDVEDKFEWKNIVSIVSQDSTFYIVDEDRGVFFYDGVKATNIVQLKNVKTITIVGMQLYIGSGKSLYIYDKTQQLLQKEIDFSAPIKQIEYNSNNNSVYVALYGKGMAQYVNREVSYVTDNNGLASNYTTAIHIDDFGLIWLGTDGAGVSQFMGFRFVHYTFNDQYDGNPVMGIYKADDIINDEMWFVTYGNGIIYKKRSQFSHLNKKIKFPSSSYYTIEKYDGDKLCFTTKDKGLVVYDVENEKVLNFNASNSPLSNSLLYVKKDERGDLYVTSKDSGLFIMHNNKWIVLGKRQGLPDNYINFIKFDKQHNLWLATESTGVIKIDDSLLQEFIEDPKQLQNFEIYKLENNRNQVMTLALDENNQIWTGLFGGGIAKVEDGRLVTIPNNEKIPSLNIYSMIYETDHSSIWAGTDKGLVRLSIDKNSSVSSMEYFLLEHGFRGVECNRNALYYDYTSKSLWVGVLLGVTRFYPNKKTLNSITPNIKVEKFSYRGRNTSFKTYKDYDDIMWDNAPQIPYDSNGVTVEFKAIDQLYPESVKYQYKMLGINEAWHQLSVINNAEYNYLPSGRYVFKLRAVNGQGKWSGSDLYMPFVVKTPYWQTNLFLAVVILVLFMLLGLVMYIRQRSLKERNFRLRRAVEERTSALKSEKVIVESHREELRTQAEHLEQTNRELEKLSLVASKTDNAVLISDKYGVWEWANEGFTKMYGYTLEEYIEENGTLITETSKSSKIQYFIEEAVSSKQSVTYSTQERCKDGNGIWVQSTLTPIFDDKNELKRFIVVQTNITHIKRINNELRKLSLVASKTDNSVFLMNKTGKIDWVNDAFHKFYEMSLEEFKVIYQKTIFDLHLDIKGLFDLNDIISSKKSKSFVSAYITKKGNKKWIQSNLTPVTMGDNTVKLIAVETDITRLKIAEEETRIQRKKSDDLLLNILPAETAEELKSQGYALPRYYNSATVLFCDFTNFTSHCRRLSPHQLVSEIREYFDRFDDVVGNNFVEKIKTIGDAYMCAGGLPIRNRSHAFNILLTALEFQKVVDEINQKKKGEGREPWELRIGIHSGKLVAGVVGKRKFAYDVWGDTVTIASRMESACEVGRINISGDTYNIVKDFFDCTYRGKVDAKNIGKIDMYFINGLKPIYALDDKGLVPNIEFQNYLASL